MYSLCSMTRKRKFIEWRLYHWQIYLGGGESRRRVPIPSKFLYFHADFRKNWPNHRLATPRMETPWSATVYIQFRSGGFRLPNTMTSYIVQLNYIYFIGNIFLSNCVRKIAFWTIVQFWSHWSPIQDFRWCVSLFSNSRWIFHHLQAMILRFSFECSIKDNCTISVFYILFSKRWTLVKNTTKALKHTTQTIEIARYKSWKAELGTNTVCIYFDI